MRLMRLLVFFVFFALCLTASAQDDALLAPEEITGEVVYVPFPVAITLDGDTSDWAGVPVTTVERGPQTSSDPAENGSFSFAVAADMERLYILMTMPDQNIVTGQHGTDFWNEDSMEFYANFTSDFAATSYTSGIFQVNINPGNIGKTDPAALEYTGVSADSAQPTGIVFKTDDGWGAEVAVLLPQAPTHGYEIGFQAQINGATEANRDVKLIWSLADTTDTSWNNPSVFGRALFFEIGSEDIPQPSTIVEEEEEEIVRAFIAVNQTGYFTDMTKRAVYARAQAVSDSPTFVVKDADTGEVAFDGVTAEGVKDSASEDVVYAIDFTGFNTPGTYILSVDGIDSAPFKIVNEIYSDLKRDALRYFYLSRSGIAIEPEFAGETYARPAGHVSDGDVACWSGEAAGKTFDPCDYRVSAAGGWYDAGDFGKYVVNGGIATWTLLNWYERAPNSFPDGSLNIPESGNGVPDILDEARWEMEWILSMQVPEGQELAGMAHHKLHALNWDGLPALPPENVDNTNPQTGRMVMPPSTAATLNLAATAAQCARIWREFDAEFADRCLAAAKSAFDAAQAHPSMLYGNIPGNGGGNYDDQNLSDEFYWAAAELYITTGEAVYHDVLADSSQFRSFPGGMWWGGTGALGTISLLTTANGLEDADLARLRDQIVGAADGYLTVINSEGYGVPLRANDYVWGSSSSVLNSAILMALAHDFTGEAAYLEGVVRSMDYLLGHNPNDVSFISGYGTRAMLNPHHRFWANIPPNFPPPPPGVVSGGTNASPSDQRAIDSIGALPPARRYIDHVDSYSTNEVAINWNAPLVWVSSYLNDKFNP